MPKKISALTEKKIFDQYVEAERQMAQTGACRSVLLETLSPSQVRTFESTEKKIFDKLILHELGMGSIPAPRPRGLKLRKHDTVVVHHLTGAVEVYKVDGQLKINRVF